MTSRYRRWRRAGPRHAVLCAAACLALFCCAGLGGASPASAAAPPSLDVSGAALLSAGTGQFLYGRNPSGELAIASTTKLMTALITLQHVHHLGEMFTQNDWYPAAADSQIGLVPGERMSVHDLILAMMLPSADDAAEDLAYNVGGGSVGRFVGMMNAEARALHLMRTHYTTPVGLDTPGNYSSPDDLVRLAAYDLKVSPFFRRVVDMRSATLYTGRYRRYVVNLNDLLGRVPWINGVKTGHTSEAGYVLVTSGTRDGMTLIDAVLGTPSQAARDASALALLQYGFANFHLVRPVVAGQLMARRPVQYSSKRAELLAGSSFTRVLRRTDRVTIRVQAPKELSGPLPRHAIVGQASILVGGRRVARIPLRLAEALPAASTLSQAGHFLTRPSTLVWIVCAAIVLVVLWRRRPRVLSRGHLEEG